MRDGVGGTAVLFPCGEGVEVGSGLQRLEEEEEERGAFLTVAQFPTERF